MCPSQFPVCYTDGDCVIEACKDGTGGPECTDWREDGDEENPNFTSLENSCGGNYVQKES